MTYLIWGSSNALIYERIREIFGTGEITTYLFKNDDIKDIIESCNYYSLFDEKNNIIVKNYQILKEKKKTDDDIEDFLENEELVEEKKYIENELMEQYLQNPNPNTNLFLICENKPDGRSKIYKTIDHNHGIIEISDLSIEEIRNKIRYLLSDYLVKNDVINYIIECCNSNYDLIVKEIEKIKEYYLNEKEIELSKIKQIVSNYLDPFLFDFTNALSLKQYDLMFKNYQELKQLKTNVMLLITTIADQYRNIYNVKCLQKEGYQQATIAQKMGVNPGVVYYTMKKTHLFSEEELLDNLSHLAQLDFDIKSGKINDYQGLDYYLLTI